MASGEIFHFLTVFTVTIETLKLVMSVFAALVALDYAIVV